MIKLTAQLNATNWQQAEASVRGFDFNSKPEHSDYPIRIGSCKCGEDQSLEYLG